MKNTEKIIIQFSGLNQGEHDFSFDIEDAFFKQIEGSLIEKGKLNVQVRFIKMSTMLHLHLSFSGKIEIACDRCLDEVFIPISGIDELVVKYSDIGDEESPNIMSILPNETSLDITLFVYEMMVLNLPFRKIPCEILNDFEVCNKAMLKKLDELATKENPTVSEVNNPLWESLNKLKNLN